MPLSHFAKTLALSEAHTQDRSLALCANAEAGSYGLYAVADGVGGTPGGAAAADMALSALTSHVATAMEGWDGIPSHVALSEVLSGAVEKVNNDVTAARTSGREVGASTLTAALVVGAGACVVHVGSGGAMLYREGEAHWVTTPHTVAGQLLHAGFIDQETAAHHPMARQLVQAIGSGTRLNPDVIRFRLFPSDRLLLATDGVASTLVRETLAAELARDMLVERTGEALVSLLAGRSQDDATFVLVGSDGDDATPADQSRLLRVLADHWLFEGLPFVDLIRVRTAGQVVRYEAGETYCSAGPQKRMGLLLSAVLRADGAPELLMRGDATLPLALVHDIDSADIEVVDGGAVYELTRRQFDGLCERYPSLGLVLLRRLVSHDRG